jgi:ABC-type amino acid transport substrate-binding protein
LFRSGPAVPTEWSKEMTMKSKRTEWCFVTAWTLVLITVLAMDSFGADLKEIREQGVLRHLGVPYTSFVTGSGDGLDVELLQRFAAHLGVRYEYVETGWDRIVGDLTGKRVIPREKDIEVVSDVPVKGDIAASGMTVLPWREKIIDFSVPTFPSPVWVIARVDSPVKPIVPSGNVEQDILAVKAAMKGVDILGKKNTCLDPHLFDLEGTCGAIKMFAGGVNEMAPAVINGEADTALLDAPDALIALQKWPGKLKVIGPISHQEVMAAGFAKSSPQLREEFNRFFERSWKDGSYLDLVKKYYPDMLQVSPGFFARN